MDLTRITYFDFLETIPDPAIVVDQAGIIVNANLPAHNAFGYAAGAMNGQPLDSHIPTEFKQSHQTHVKNFNQQPTRREMGIGRVFYGLRQDGSQFPMDIMLSPIKIGGSSYVLCIGRDISERLQLERQFQTIIQTTLDGFWLVDLQGNFLQVNQAYCQMVGYADYELLNMNIKDVEAIESPAGIQKRIQRTIEAGSQSFETKHKARDGSLVDIEISANYFANDEESRIFVFLRDITERKQMHSELERRVEERTAQLTTLNQTLNDEIEHRNQTEKELLANYEILNETVYFNQLVMSASSIAFLVYEGESGQCITANQAAAEIVGAESPQKMLQQNFRSISSWQPTGLLTKAEAALKSDQEQQVESQFTTTFGKQIYLHGAFNTFVQAGKQHLLFSFADITEVQQSRTELSKAYDATIEGWARALELRDPLTEGHTRRVADRTVQLARLLGFSEEELILIYRGAILHDIGKIAISDTILNKPDVLDETEIQEIQHHPDYAVDMLAPIEYLSPAMDIPHYHHERWNGSGYPAGLKGDAIPYAARIFAVVDVWDALRMDRPYRKSWSRKKTHDYLAENQGKLFDPQVVSAYFKLLAA